MPAEPSEMHRVYRTKIVRVFVVCCWLDYSFCDITWIKLPSACWIILVGGTYYILNVKLHEYFDGKKHIF